MFQRLETSLSYCASVRQVRRNDVVAWPALRWCPSPGWRRLPGCDLRRGSLGWLASYPSANFLCYTFVVDHVEVLLTVAFFPLSITGCAIVAKQVDRLRWEGRGRAGCLVLVDGLHNTRRCSTAEESASWLGVATKLLEPLIPGGGA